MELALRPEVVTLGCRLNIAEGEAIRSMLGNRDLVVVNSCAVTNAAVKETRAAIRRAARARPGAEIVVTGCAAEIDPTGFASMPEVSRIVGNRAKLVPASWDTEALPVPSFDGHARAFVEVQNGCDHRCTFCAIPFGRGPSRSVPAGVVIEHVAHAVDAGKREVVLTGVDVTSYGSDLPGAPTLGSLVERILLHVPRLERLRLSSLDAIEIDPALFDLVTGEARVMPHLHLSLQAGSDLILKRMKRRHLRADAIALVARIKARRDVAIGADLIAGFPTEDEGAFADTLAILDDCDVVHPHIFPFSARAGTPAARMPQVAFGVVRDRAARLRAAAGDRRARWLQTLVGSEQAVLVERSGTTGHAAGFTEVRLSPAEAGSIQRVHIAAATRTHLEGICA